MALTSEQQQLKDQAIAGKRQQFLQRLEKLAADMSSVFTEMEAIGRAVAVNPVLSGLTDEELASLGKHYNAANLQAVLAAMNEIKTESAAKQWTAKILGI